MKRLLRWYIALKHNEKGATAVEYGLIVALIAVAIIAVLGVLGGGLKGLFERVAGEISSAATS